MSPDHRLSHADIGKETGVAPANVTYQIDALRNEGYVRRVPNETDRRVTFVELTPKGEEVCDWMIPQWTRFMSQLGKVFTDEEKILTSKHRPSRRESARADGRVPLVENPLDSHRRLASPIHFEYTSNNLASNATLCCHSAHSRLAIAVLRPDSRETY